MRKNDYTKYAAVSPTGISLIG